jgi:hypothetical protein
MKDWERGESYGDFQVGSFGALPGETFRALRRHWSGGEGRKGH